MEIGTLLVWGVWGYIGFKVFNMIWETGQIQKFFGLTKKVINENKTIKSKMNKWIRI